MLLAFPLRAIISLDAASFSGGPLRASFVQLLDEAAMRALTVHPFGVLLRAGLALPAMSHASAISV